jgi:hypothetical protein
VQGDVQTQGRDGAGANVAAMADDPKAKRRPKPGKRNRRWTEDPDTSARVVAA